MANINDLLKDYLDYLELTKNRSLKTQRNYEHYLKVSPEDLEQDVFIDGYVDKMIFQSTYLYDWYTEGFNTADRNGGIKELLRVPANTGG